MSNFKLYSLDFTTINHGNGIALAIGTSVNNAFSILQSQGYLHEYDTYTLKNGREVGLSCITQSTLVYEEASGYQVLVGPKGDKGDTGPQGESGIGSVTTQSTTTFTGLVKGSGGYMAQAVAGEDYAAQESIDIINNKIPTEATSSNQLADKNYVATQLNNTVAPLYKGIYNISDSTDYTKISYVVSSGDATRSIVLLDKQRYHLLGSTTATRLRKIEFTPNTIYSSGTIKFIDGNNQVLLTSNFPGSYTVDGIHLKVSVDSATSSEFNYNLEVLNSEIATTTYSTIPNAFNFNMLTGSTEKNNDYCFIGTISNNVEIFTRYKYVIGTTSDWVVDYSLDLLNTTYSKLGIKIVTTSEVGSVITQSRLVELTNCPILEYNGYKYCKCTPNSILLDWIDDSVSPSIIYNVYILSQEYIKSGSSWGLDNVDCLVLYKDSSNHYHLDNVDM